MSHQRQLRWNVISYNDGDPPRQEYTFVLVNKPREIDIMRQRIKEVLQPTDNESTIAEGLIPNSGGLHYIGLQIDSHAKMTPDDFNPRKIYDSKTRGTIKRDEKLGHHRTIDGLANYIDNMFSS